MQVIKLLQEKKKFKQTIVDPCLGSFSNIFENAFMMHMSEHFCVNKFMEEIFDDMHM